MDFRNQRFGVQYNSGHFQDLTRDEDIEHHFGEVYEIDDLFDKIKDGK
jgi:hypothetical protein